MASSLIRHVRPCIRTLYAQRVLSTSAVRHDAVSHPVADPAQRPAQIESRDRDNVYPKIGTRKIVGFGKSGLLEYEDISGWPCPAIDFQEENNEILALREKEKGDWNAMSVEEKKRLYRTAFRQTYAEFTAPTGEWKPILAIFIWSLVASGVMMIWLKQYVYLPVRTRNKEWQAASIADDVKSRTSPIHGYASKFDYENNRWK